MRCYVERQQVCIAEYEAAWHLYQIDGSQRLPLRGVDLDVVGRHVEIAFLVQLEAVWRATDFRYHHALIGCRAPAIHVERIDAALVGDGDVERLAICGERDAGGACFELCDQIDGPSGRDVEDAVEVELSQGGLCAEGRVGEEGVSVFADNEVVWTVQLLAFEGFGYYVDLACLVLSDDAAVASLAGVERAVLVEDVARRAVGIVADQLGLLVGSDFPDAVHGHVAEDKELVGGPCGCVGKCVA